MLKDSYGRLHTYLRISVTDRCNLNCRYCMPPGGIALVDRRQILRPEEIGQIAQLFADLGIGKIRLTGGEPLIRRGLDVILDHLNTIRPRPELAITTNGLLLEGWVDHLAASGVRGINISLDTLRPDRFTAITGVDGWPQVWAGVNTALRNPGIERVKLNVVVQRGVNDDEIDAFARLTQNEALEVRFIELMPGRWVSWRSDELVTAAEMLERLPGLVELPGDIAMNAGPARLYHYPGAAGRVGLISGLSRPACSGCNRLRLTAQGELLRCLFDAEGLDLRSALRSSVPSAEIADGIKAFLLGKRYVGMGLVQRNAAVSYSPCLAVVGG